MPLPTEFRFYDFGPHQYRIWAVVRYIEANPADENKLTTFTLGVAFIGNDAPASYRLDPTTHYDLKPTLARGGAWVARPQPRRSVSSSAETNSGSLGLSSNGRSF